MYSMPLYEARYRETGEWEEVTEVELMEGLYAVFDKVTPAIQEMMQGKEIITPQAVYRLKIKGGEYASAPTP